jgi:hypothetical protein
LDLETVEEGGVVGLRHGKRLGGVRPALGR